MNDEYTQGAIDLADRLQERLSKPGIAPGIQHTYKGSDVNSMILTILTDLIMERSRTTNGDAYDDGTWKK